MHKCHSLSCSSAVPHRDRTLTLDIPLHINPDEPSGSLTSRASFARQMSFVDTPRGTDRLRLEIVDLEAEIERMNKMGVQSTRNMLREVEEANDSGIRALAALEEQDEQLDRIESDLDQIRGDVEEMQTHLRTMRSFCGLGHYVHKYIRYPIRKLLGKGRRRGTLSASSSTDGAPLVVSLSSRNKIQRKGTNEYGSRRLTADEVEIDSNLEKVEEGVRTLKEVAFDVHTQLEIQRPKLDRIYEMAEENDFNIVGANKTVRKMLK